MSVIDDIREAVVDGEQDDVESYVQDAIDEGIDPDTIINDGLVGGMDVVAPLFRDGEMFVPEVMECADCMQAGMQVLKPVLGEAGIQSKGKVVIGTIDGDLHDIGKNLVVLMLESNGYDVIDLGIDVEAETFVEAVKENQPDIVGFSAMLTTTMMEMDKNVKVFEEEGIRDQVKIIVGGAPITQEFADEIHADGYSSDASACVTLCDSIMAAK